MKEQPKKWKKNYLYEQNSYLRLKKLKIIFYSKNLKKIYWNWAIVVDWMILKTLTIVLCRQITGLWFFG